MPIDFSEHLRRIEQSAQPGAKPLTTKGTPLLDLFTPVPEGGNAKVKGRDHGAVALLGHLHKNGLDYDLALSILQMWNTTYCKPPLDPAALTEKAGRLWLNFRSNEESADEIGTAAQAITFLDIPRMEEEAAKSASQGWILEGGIPAGGLVYITAPPAFGKTWVVLDLIRACLTGTRWLQKYQVEQTAVMYLDEEMGVSRVLPRIQKLGIPRNSDLLYANRESVKLDNKAHREQICDTVRKYNIKMIVVDSLTRIHSMDEASNKDMSRLYSYMREIMDLGATLIVCHHDRKGGQGDSNVGHDRARGAGDIMAAADMVYSVEKTDGVHKIVCTKSRLVAEDDAIECEFLIEDNDDKTAVTLRPANNQEISFRNLDAAEDAVVKFLRQEITASTTQLKDGIKMSNSKVGAALESLVREGTVIKGAGDRGSVIYWLKPKEDDGELF